MIPIFSVVYQLADPNGRNQVDFTDNTYIQALKGVEKRVNDWLDDKRYACNLKVLLTQKDIIDAFNLYNELQKNPSGQFYTLDSSASPNFKLPTSQLFSIVVLYDNSCSQYNAKEVDKALQRFGQDAVQLKYFKEFEIKDKNRLFELVKRSMYVRIKY